MKLSPAQREVLAAIGRSTGEVFRDDRPPYTAYLRRQGERDKPVSATVAKLFDLDLITLGERERFIRYFKLTDKGREVLGS